MCCWTGLVDVAVKSEKHPRPLYRRAPLFVTSAHDARKLA